MNLCLRHNIRTAGSRSFISGGAQIPQLMQNPTGETWQAVFLNT